MQDEERELAIRGESREFQRGRLATARWADGIAFSDRYTYEDGDFWLGRSPVTGDAIGYRDDRHAFLCSGSRSGKGTSIIINNLCSWQGSAVILDPKGENASVTAARRGHGSEFCEGMGQEVHVLDPFREAQVEDSMRSRFNPLDAIDMESMRFNDDAMRIVNAIIIKPEHSKDKFFDLTAQDLLRGVILHVKSDPDYEGRRNLATVRQLLTRGEHENVKLFREHNPDKKPPCPYELLWYSMSQNEAGNGIIAGIGERMLSAKRDASETYQGIYQTCLTETIFLDSPGIQETTSTSDFELSDLKTSKDGLSVYLCLSLDDMDNYFKWLRIMISLTVSVMIKTKGKPATGHHVLMCLDEFPVLRRMKLIEDSVAQLAGYGLKMFFVVQNLGQLKTIYKDNWETFLGNSGVKLFFALNDHYFTMKYVSDVIGETEVSRDTMTLSQAESETSSESKGTNSSVAEGKTKSISRNTGESRTVGESNSRAEGHSTSETLGTSTNLTEGRSRSFNTNQSHSDSSNWGSQSGKSRNRGGNSGHTSGYSSSSTSSIGAASSWGYSQMFNRSQGSNWGTGDSTSQSRGGGHSSSHSRGQSQGSSLTRSTGRSHSETTGKSITNTRGTSESFTQSSGTTDSEGESLTETKGESRQSTESRGTTSTKGINQGLHPRPLLAPSEANTWFAHLPDKQADLYPGLCLVLVSGEHPTAVLKANYFEDIRFAGWYDAHPDHPENAPLPFSQEIELATGFETGDIAEALDGGLRVEKLHVVNGEFVEAGQPVALIGRFCFEREASAKHMAMLVTYAREAQNDAVSVVERNRLLVYSWIVRAPVSGEIILNREEKVGQLGVISTNRRRVLLEDGYALPVTAEAYFRRELIAYHKEILKAEEEEAERFRDAAARAYEAEKEREADERKKKAEEERQRRADENQRLALKRAKFEKRKNWEWNYIVPSAKSEAIESTKNVFLGALCLFVLLALLTLDDGRAYKPSPRANDGIIAVVYGNDDKSKGIAYSIMTALFVPPLAAGSCFVIVFGSQCLVGWIRWKDKYK